MELYECYNWSMNGKAEDMQVGEGQKRLSLLAASQMIYV